jgi:ATP-dependent RNA helicase DeaD
LFQVLTGAELRGGDRDRGDRGPREAVATERGYTSYKVGVGHSHGARPPGIVGAMTGEGGLHGKDIGKIQIFPHFSLVQIRGSLTPEQMERISRAKLGGRELRIGPDRGPRGGGKGPRRDGERPFRRDDRGDRSDRSDRGGRYEGKRRPFRREG